MPTQMPRNGRPDAAALDGHVVEPRRSQRLHARAERADAGQHHRVGLVDERRGRP